MSFLLEKTLPKEILPQEVFHQEPTIQFFSQEQMSLLDQTRIPKHVAIIPDGNRRWAKKESFHPNEGHHHGADILMDVVNSAQEIGIKTLTFYTFSTENWNRDPDEVAGLMWLIQNYLSDKCSEMIKSGVKFDCIGDMRGVSASLYQTIQETKKATAHCEKIDMVLAINYGSRDEICRAIQSIAADCSAQKIMTENITQELISSYLDTHKWSDPELLIRTSGEMRISNFLLWQLSYAEIYVSNVLWPDYRPNHLFQAIYNYQQRHRRLGGP